MKVEFIGSSNNQLEPNTIYTAFESIYSDYYELKEVKGFRFLKNLFRRVM